MPVYQDAVLFLVAAMLFATLFVIVTVLGLISRRRVARRLAALADRVPGPPVGPSMEDILGRLEQSVDETRYVASAASTTAGRLQAAVDAMAVGVVLCDEHGDVVFANAAAKTRFSAVTSVDLDQSYSDVVDAALGGRPTARGVEILGPPPLALTLTGIPLHDGRRSMGAAVVVEDLSGGRIADADRRQLLTDLARELTEPLVALSVLADGVEDEADPEVRRRLADKARGEAQRARRLLEDLVEMSRLLSEEPALSERVPVDEVLTRGRDQAVVAARRRLVMVGQPPDVWDLALVGPRAQLEAVAAKLIEQAAAGTRVGGRIELDARQVGTTIELEARRCGTGSGIEARPGMTGAILSQLARNLGGSVAEEVGADQDSRVVLRLPAADPSRL